VPVLQQVGGEAVPQGVGRRPLRQPGRPDRRPEVPVRLLGDPGVPHRVVPGGRRGSAAGSPAGRGRRSTRPTPGRRSARTRSRAAASPARAWANSSVASASPAGAWYRTIGVGWVAAALSLSIWSARFRSSRRIRHSPRLWLWNPTATNSPSATALRAALAAPAAASSPSTRPRNAARPCVDQRPHLRLPPEEPGEVVGQHLAEPEPVVGREVLLDRLPVHPPVPVQVAPPAPLLPPHDRPRCGVRRVLRLRPLPRLVPRERLDPATTGSPLGLPPTRRPTGLGHQPGVASATQGARRREGISTDRG
jgi:hypothetical protein